MVFREVHFSVAFHGIEDLEKEHSAYFVMVLEAELPQFRKTIRVGGRGPVGRAEARRWYKVLCKQAAGGRGFQARLFGI